MTTPTARAEDSYLREPDEPADRCDMCDCETCTCDDEYDAYRDRELFDD